MMSNDQIFVGISRSGRSATTWHALVESATTRNLGSEPHDRIELAVHDALLERDQRVVCDLDGLGAHLGAALSDVAHTKTMIILRRVLSIELVQRVHVEFGDAHQEPRPAVGLLVFLVVTDDVADVLAQEAFDALAEL